jgi:eukaryotic-like serine/threonine-protein kinase
MRSTGDFPQTLSGGRYHVLRRLGSGGTSTVFLARDTLLQRDVALKRLHGAEVTAETSLRLRREAQIMAALRHPNLVAVFDMLVESDDLLLAMEYVAGGTLADVLRAGPVGWPRARELLEPVATALDYAHAEGVVHRDVKPSNVLVGDTGVVKLADMGLATAAEITRITPPGVILGTPAYMAPEQARSGPCTPAVDVYALATIVYQALSGALPRPGRTVMAILAQATREPPPDLRVHRPATPAAAAAALARAMSAEPDSRPRSACALLRELDAAFAGDPDLPRRRFVRPAGPGPPVRAESSSPTTRARVLAVGALAAGMLVAVLVVVLLTRGPSGTPAAQTRSGAAAPRGTAPAQASASPSATATATHAPPPLLSATATVRAFYRRAAARDYRAAWRLAGPAMRRAFGNSFDRFRTDLASLRHIEFERVQIVDRSHTSATLQIETIATHTERVDRCTGTLRTVRNQDGRWLVEPAGVRCTSE